MFEVRRVAPDSDANGASGLRCGESISLKDSAPMPQRGTTMKPSCTSP